MDELVDPVFEIAYERCVHWQDLGFVGGCYDCHRDEYIARIRQLETALEEARGAHVKASGRNRIAWWLFDRFASDSLKHKVHLHVSLYDRADSTVYTMPNGSTSGFHKLEPIRRQIYGESW